MIYWDYNSTTPCAPEVVEAMMPYWMIDYGNPESVHQAGRRSAIAIAKARSQLASLVGCQTGEIVFTSGATESNNLIFLGLLLYGSQEKKRIVSSPIEHKSVLEPLKLLSDRGFEIIHLPVTNDGVVDIDAARECIDESTVLVSLQLANNEIGTIQPIEELTKIAHQKGAYFHTDAAQALGKIPFDLEVLDCDFASFSAHKMYGPKGIGALFVKGGPSKWPWIRPLMGGGQEGGLRPGTSNVPAIVGFGVACNLSIKGMSEDNARILKIRNLLEDAIERNFGGSLIHGKKSQRLPGTCSFSLSGIDAETIVLKCREHCMSRGSACTANSLDNSHVIKALTQEQNVINSTIRLSLGRWSKHTDIDLLIECIKKVALKMEKS